MSSTSLKHQAHLQDWAAAIQDCRSRGMSVRQWCKENGTTPTTYYRWEREVLAIAETSRKTPGHTPVAFAELPAPPKVTRNVSECSATLHIGSGSIDIYQELTPELLQTLVRTLQSC